MISPHRIVYNNYSSEDFDLICELAFDSDSGDTETFLSREAVISESYRGEFKRIHNFKYTESFSPQFTFIDKNFGDISSDRQRKILKWLTGSPNASFVSVYHDDSEVISWEALGGFIEISSYKLGNGRVVGFVATFEASTPYALSPLKSATVSGSNTDATEFNINTDEPESLIYPRITIKQDEYSGVVSVSEFNEAEMIDGTVYLYQDKYYWKGLQWVGNAAINITPTPQNGQPQSFGTDVTYEKKEIAISSIESLTVQKLASILSDDVWNTIQWQQVEEGHLVGSIYESVANEQFDKDQEYYIVTGIFSNSSVYKELIKDNGNYRIENAQSAKKYQKTDITAESFINFRESLYIKTDFQIEIFINVHTNALVKSEVNPNLNTTSTVITNIYEDINDTSHKQQVVVKNNSINETIILDGANRVVSSDRSNRIFGDNFGWNWLSFVEGKNTIKVIGNCTVTFEWREPMKLGI